MNIRNIDIYIYTPPNMYVMLSYVMLCYYVVLCVLFHFLGYLSHSTAVHEAHSTALLRLPPLERHAESKPHPPKEELEESLVQIRPNLPGDISCTVRALFPLGGIAW